MNSSTRGTRVHAQAASQTHALCINDLAASGVIESSPAHLEGGEIGPSILETARLKNGFDRKRESPTLEQRGFCQNENAQLQPTVV